MSAVSEGSVTVILSISFFKCTWQPNLDVSVRPSAKSSMSSSSSSGSGNESKTFSSRITWHVEQAISPPHAPSTSISLSWATSRRDWPKDPSTVSSSPSASTKRTLICGSREMNSKVFGINERKAI